MFTKNRKDKRQREIEMSLTDTNCHLADSALSEMLPQVLTAARKVAV